MTPSSHALEVDVFGVPTGQTGWSVHSVGFAQALNKLTPVNFHAGRRDTIRGLFGANRLMLLRGLHSLRRLRGAPKAHGDFGVVIVGDALNAQLSARWVVWETTKLPESQLKLCDSVRYLWTPSTWGRLNLIANGIDASRIAVVPEGVDSDFFRPVDHPVTGKSGRFRFLMVGKWEDRKISSGLLKAFTEEFRPNEDVELYLHAHNSHIPDFSLKREIEVAGFSGASNVVLGVKCTPRALRRLYQSANCFVLPTRAEGWGLPIMESMACGVPAIVTRYSAPMDFVTEENGFLLNVAAMVEAHNDYGIGAGLWAEPDILHLRHLMRTAFENRKLLHDKSHEARKTAEHFSWDHAAQVALHTITQHLHESNR